MSVQVNIDDEVNGRQISLMLTSGQYERAQIDSEYVQQLVQDFNTTEDTEHISVDTRSLFIWNEACIFLLLSLYEEYKEDFTKKRHKMVFDVIARRMCDANSNYNINGSQCQSKVNSLKKQYKKIVDHNATSGNNRATWPYFDRMTELFGSTGWANPEALASETGPFPDENSPLTQNEPKKRKLDSVLSDFTRDLKKFREEKAKVKQENFNTFLEMKERQHREKMQILQSLCSNNNI